MSGHYVAFELYARHKARHSLKSLCGSVFKDHAVFVQAESIVDRHDCRKRWTTLSFSLASRDVDVFKAIESIRDTLRANGVHATVEVVGGSFYV